MRVIVVGGGIGGLATAWRLHQAGVAEVELLEAGERLGGVTWSYQRDGFLAEAGPDAMVRTKPAGLQLCQELGLGEELIGTRTEARRSLIARGRRLVPVPEGMYLMAPGKLLPFAFSPIISWAGKLRMGLDLLLPRRAADGPEESLADFVRRRLGREALARIAQPMIGGIYTGDPERLSLAATMPMFLELEREHRSLILAMRARSKAEAAAASSTHGTSGPRYGLFVSLRGGLGALSQRLAERLVEAGVRCRSGCRVRGLTRLASGWQLDLDGASTTADAVVLALPAHAAAVVLRSSAPALAELLSGIEYASIATVNVAVAADQVPDLPEAAGFVVPAIEHRLLVACTFASRKFAGRAPEGQVLLRGFVGGALHEGDLDRDDASLSAGVVDELRQRLGLRGEPLWTAVHRWPRAMAQPVIGHRERVAAIRAQEAATPGLALVGNGYEGVGIGDLVAQGTAATQRLLTSQGLAADEG